MLPVLGRADDMRAEVWIACDPAAAGIEPHGDEPLRMAGRLAGPTCTLAATLPMTATIVDQGAVAGRRPLGRVTCTEPGFWTPDVPCLYRASVELVRGGRTVASGERTLGLRRTGVRDGSIRLDGKRYVPRGVGFTGGGEEIASLRTLHAAAVVDEDHLTADLSASADRRGVVIVARARSGHGGPAAVGDRADWIEGLAVHPSTLLVVLPASLPPDEIGAIASATARRRGTMLVGLARDGSLPPTALPAGIDLWVVELPAGGVPHDEWRRTTGMAMIALERTGGGPPERARAACDTLQARLAAWGTASPGHRPPSWAGYLVA